MHPSGSNRQRENQPETSPEPPWLKPVKRAVVVMSVLIVIGLGLLVYGVAVRLGPADTPGGASLRLLVPDAMRAVAFDRADDGTLTLFFASDSGHGKIIGISPGSAGVFSVLEWSPHQGDAFRLE